MSRFRLLFVMCTALVLALAPTSAFAAPAYVTSDPENHEEMDQAPSEVRVVFDNPLDQSSLLLITDECSRRVDDGNVVVAGNTISVGVAKTPKGVYTVAWKVRAPAGVGGDANGQIIFHVNEGDPCGPPSERTNTGGHGNHGGDGGDGGHGNHGGDDDHGDDGEHTGHDSTGGDHAGHDAATGDPSAHSESGGHGDHGEGNGDGNGKHKNHGNGDAEDPSEVAAPEPPTLAGAEDDGPTVTGSDVLAALLISLVLGAAGGWLIRNLNPA